MQLTSSKVSEQLLPKLRQKIRSRSQVRQRKIIGAILKVQYLLHEYWSERTFKNRLIWSSCFISVKRDFLLVTVSLCLTQTITGGRSHCSVTRLGEMSPLWPTFNSLWLFLEVLYFCLNIQSTLAIFYATLEQIFVAEFAKYRKHNLAIWSHWRSEIILVSLF